jgi:hypothetical protein
MTMPNTINLIRTKTTNSTQFDAIETSLRRSGYIFLIFVLCTGLLLGVLYVLFSSEEKNLLSQKSEYVARVNSDKNAEGIFRSIKDRTRIVESTMTSKKPWSQLLDDINAIETPPVLSRISVDNQNKIVMTVNADSINTLLPIVNALIARAQTNRFVNPQMTSFQISKTGDVIASFSFLAVF